MSFGMRESMVLCIPLLYESQYSALFHNDFLADSAEKHEFSLISFLHNHLTQLHESALISSTKFSHYEETLKTLNKLFAAAAKQKSSSIFYKWIFFHDPEVYRYMRVEHDKFELKLLYAYTLCIQLCKRFVQVLFPPILQPLDRLHRMVQTPKHGHWRMGGPV